MWTYDSMNLSHLDSIWKYYGFYLKMVWIPSERNMDPICHSMDSIRNNLGRVKYWVCEKLNVNHEMYVTLIVLYVHAFYHTKYLSKGNTSKSKRKKSLRLEMMTCA